MMRCVSLFSGCGGLDLGLKRAGFKIIFANDLEPICRDSHVANFRGTPFFPGSVLDITRDVLRDVSGGVVRDGVDLLAGGPPCPAFSKSRFYRKEKPRALNDPNGSAGLNGYLNVLRHTQPRAFLFENVPGFAYDVHRDAFDTLAAAAEDEGYTVTHDVLNAADYGVPQIRQRFIMVGMRGAKFEFPAATHHDPGADGSLFGAALEPWVPVGDVLRDLDTDENADDSGHRAGGKHAELLREIPPGENYLYFTKERGYAKPLFKWRSRYWSFLLKLSPDKPSWTIQARRSNNMGPFHWRNRILRIGEVKRIQTFPDEWVLAGTVEQQWRQVGNAVPPLLAEVLGTAIRRTLTRAGRKDGKAKATRLAECK